MRLVLTILGEARAFRRRLRERGRGRSSLLEQGGRAAGVICVDGESGERFEVAAENVINATGVWADRIRPEEIHDEEDVPRIAPSRGTHVTVSMEQLAVGQAACIVPAGEERDDLRPALVRPGADRDHRQRLRGRHLATCNPPSTTSSTCSTP